MLADTLRQMRADGVKRAVAFATSAFGSYSGCRQYIEDITRARVAVGEGAPEIVKIRPFSAHPKFIEAMTDRVRTALKDLPDGRLGFALGDVSGKGAPAALLTAMVQGMFAVQAVTSSGPAEALALINRGLKRRSVESRFVTMFYGIVGADGTLSYCNAGHNPPVLVKKDCVVRLETGGMILGLFDFATYDQDTVQMEAGDTLVVFSDGISEAQDVAGEEYGDERLIECLTDNRGATPAGMREALLTSARVFTAGASQGDDMTVLIVRYGT
jgi:sigma-B regulation protein RsbU (phosphoserine phosphatase)